MDPVILLLMSLNLSNHCGRRIKVLLTWNNIILYVFSSGHPTSKGVNGSLFTNLMSILGGLNQPNRVVRTRESSPRDHIVSHRSPPCNINHLSRW